MKNFLPGLLIGILLLTRSVHAQNSLINQGISSLEDMTFSLPDPSVDDIENVEDKFSMSVIEAC